MPDSIEIYPGTSGKTHGDKNEISPAKNAPANETSVMSRFPYRKHSRINVAVILLMLLPQRGGGKHSLELSNIAAIPAVPR
jgi:hypothetical protein